MENIEQAFLPDPSVEVKRGQGVQLWLDIHEGGRWAGPPASGEAQASGKEATAWETKDRVCITPSRRQLIVWPYAVPPPFSLSFHRCKCVGIGLGTSRDLPPVKATLLYA